MSLIERRITGDMYSSEPTDMFGTAFQRSDLVAKATDYPRSGSIEVSRVTRIDRGRIYLCDSTVPVRYPGRLINLSSLPGHMRRSVTIDATHTAQAAVSWWGGDGSKF